MLAEAYRLVLVEHTMGFWLVHYTMGLEHHMFVSLVSDHILVFSSLEP